jgi:hypothetical protein
LAASDAAPPSDAAQGKAVELIRPKVGFVLQRVGNRYEPVVHYDETFRLPGTHMRFAAYTYLVPDNEIVGEPRYGFLLDDGRFYYLDEPSAPVGNAQYGLIGDYFVVDGSACGASGLSRTMYLFRYDKDFMRLIDVVDETHEAFSPPGFMSDYPGKPAYGHELSEESNDVPVWVITEKDRQGHPLIRLEMVRDLPPTVLGPEEFEVFHLYLKIVNGRLRVALDPGLYETLFDSVKETGGPDSRSTEYYVSGFLSGKLSLARIKADLGGKKHRQWLVDYLRHVRRWDEALHKRYGDPWPRIVEYKLNRR